MSTASVESCAVVLHDDSGDAVLEGLVEFAESSDDEVDEVVDVCVGFLLIIDGLHVLVRVLLPDAEQVVHRVVHDLHHLLRNELLLTYKQSTSPSSIQISYKIIISNSNHHPHNAHHQKGRRKDSWNSNEAGLTQITLIA